MALNIIKLANGPIAYLAAAKTGLLQMKEEQHVSNIYYNFKRTKKPTSTLNVVVLQDEWTINEEDVSTVKAAFTEKDEAFRCAPLIPFPPLPSFPP